MTVVQMAYPGICTNGSPASEIPWTGITNVKGTKRPKQMGSIYLTFEEAGSIFLTNPTPGQCDANWVRVVVNPPAPGKR